ncbi:hypothetical protein EXE46_15725 [Halorubrum sp. GN11_10-6_MGM]|uniref:hypothetical protein n=1 Tax=Halorubrum sp. GN11_10-6_MGM TaxID=2518112 RepID=UPI0010F4B326|nr:hypothetical protein [Halorubrum sp. GN11_10-6_MGM]TKX72494.1 hypothetical protein EXE46_15725 [Halorubrum sp. GN11_10-6_MGM]
MTANATRRDRDRPARPDRDDASRRLVPMTGTGDGPRPDPAAFAPAARADDERRTDQRPAAERRNASNRTADDPTTQ